MLRAADNALLARAATESHRWDSLSAVARDRRGVTLPLFRFQTCASTRPQQGIIVGIERQRRMQQQATCPAAFADRSIPIGFCSPSAKDQFAGVLDNDDLSTDDTLGRPRSRMARHLRNTYPLVAQKTREPNLPCSVPGKPPNAGTRPTNEGRMQSRPPFSKRRSPNRPSPNAIVIRPSSASSPPARESVFADLSNKRCVHSIAGDRAFLSPSSSQCAALSTTWHRRRDARTTRLRRPRHPSSPKGFAGQRRRSSSTPPRPPHLPPHVL